MNFHQIIDSPVGPLYIEEDDGKLVEINFMNGKIDANGEILPRSNHQPNGIRENTPLLKKVSKQLDEYFAGKRIEFDLPLAQKGTEFQSRAWKALLEIPYGETISYRAQAEKLGNPNYQRAVGGANNRNPISIVVPCHRVIGKNGGLTGYGGGLEIKSKLLDLEIRTLKSPSAKG